MIESLVRFSVFRRVTVLMVSLAVLAFGSVGLSRLSVNLLPSLSYPSLTVQTQFANAASAEVELLVTKPVEEAVGVLKGLKQIHSVSRPGISEVTLEFGWNAKMSELAMDIREKLDRIELPLDVEKPIVLRYDPALDPIVKLSLSGSIPLTRLRYLAEKEVKENLERIEGVASSKVQGGEEEEIHININQGKVAALGISLSQLEKLLASSNTNQPGGSLKNTQTQMLVRTINEYESLDEIRNLRIFKAGESSALQPDVVKKGSQENQNLENRLLSEQSLRRSESSKPENQSVRLSEIAEVVWSSKDKEEITRFQGEEGVLISLYKEGDANTVDVGNLVKERLFQIQQKLPEGVSIKVQFDQSRFIQQSIEEVKKALLTGGFLAVCIVWLFLRNLRLTLIITTAIPLSVIATFIFMYRADVSLNIMSLGGLTLGVGMLVDSAIVVLESIYKEREQGKNVVQSAISGTSKVGGAVIASVLTTIAVFLPIVFVEGIAGQLFRDQALTVTFSLIASLLVSFTLIPMLASSIGASEDRQKENNDDEFSQDNKRFFSRFSDYYEVLLKKALHFKWSCLTGAFAALFLALQLLPAIPTSLIPTMSEGEFYFDVSLPEGTALPTTDKVMLAMEKIALAHPGVAYVYTSTGSRNVTGGLSLKTRDENLGHITVIIKDRVDHQLEKEVINDLRNAYAEIPQVDIQFGQTSFFSLKPPLELLFYGEDLQKLREYSLSLIPLLEKTNGVTDIQASLEIGNPELMVQFDRNKLAQYGLTIQAVANTLHQRVNGTIVSRFQEPDRQIDIRLRNREVDRNSMSDIENMVIAEVKGRPMTLSAVARVVKGQGPAAIDRIQQSRVAIIAAGLSGRSLKSVTAELEQLIQANPAPPGILFEFGGQNKEMQSSFNDMIFAVILAVFLIYIVMASTFEHMGHPLIILFTIPLALTGVLVGLYMTGYAISVISMIGAVFLIGVVVNNAIVLIDAINQMRRRGMAKLDAIVMASRSRLRPILMTTFTTVLGLLPMAIGTGEGAELRAPLAVVVSFGLVVATGLTLFIIPAAYLIMPSRVITDEELNELDKNVLMAEEKESHHAMTDT